MKHSISLVIHALVGWAICGATVGIGRPDMTNQAKQWRCPACGHRFTSRNLSHSCGNVRLADRFKDRSRAVRSVFNRWRDLARSCGPVTVYAQKSRIVFQGRVRFSAAIVHADWLETTLWLGRRAEHACVLRTDSLGRLGYYLHFRLRDVTDVDGRLEALLREAYAEHATAPNTPARPPVRRT